MLLKFKNAHLMMLDKMIAEGEDKKNSVIDKITIDPKEAMGLLNEIINLKMIEKITIREPATDIDMTTKELMWIGGVDKTEHIKAIIQKWYKSKYKVTYSNYPVIIVKPVIDVPKTENVNPWLGESHLDKPRPPPPPVPASARSVTGSVSEDSVPPMTKQFMDSQVPERPKCPPNRILQEGNVLPVCQKCGSSWKTKLFFFKGGGCIQPECENYWKTNDK